MSKRRARRQKLNAIRLLEARKIPHRVLHYDSQIRDAQLVAAAVGCPAEMTFKTLVALSAASGKPILALLPANTTLNLKRLAKALGEKKVALAPHADAERLTGLQVGGISPLALMHKRWRICLDRRALAHSQIVISAGQRGLQVQMPTRDLIDLLKCEMIDLAQETPD